MKGGGEHRRGRSMGSTTPRPDNKDEDLALFHEMKRREKHNFLHPSPDDLDVSLSSKFGGMEAPAKKSVTDLLTSDVDKNDYDWLLTPPGTPLFPSLDQEAAALAVISPQASLLGSSSATSSKLPHSPTDPSPKSTRGNPSPRRAGSTTPNGTMSRSRSTPHNSTSVVATVTRPSTPNSSLTRPSTPTAKSSSTPSVRASTPNLKLSISASKSSSSTASTPTGTRPSTPNARSSTPPVRPSTPGARSSTPTSKPSTPTMRRSLSGGRIASSPATTRGGPSPKRTTSSRGNSPSAKRVTPVITNVPGMCSEAPPNLRTTVPERTSSTPKSSSNGSRSVSESGHGSDAMDVSGRSRRRPRSPSVSRSFSSSSSQDQRTSSQTSRGSVISSYDDGIEVSRPTFQSSRNSAAGKWHAAGHEDLLSGKANTNVQAKRVTKSLVISSSSSVSGGTPTKKSLEPNKWQGEAYQHSPSSYRHLVASSPGSPFYGSRANSFVRPVSAMNSSVTTSSNASSEHGTTVAPDTEGSERDEDDLLSWDSYGRRMSPSPRGRQADILMLEKDEEKVGAWQDHERCSSNDLVASFKPGIQSTLDTEVTSFYESDGIASFEMLEQLGLMGEVYASKKVTPGERVLERRASNIEDGKAELRRSGERTLQRRASNIEDSRIPDLRRSDDGNGLKSATKKSDHDGHSNSGHQSSKSMRQELLESLNDTRKYDGDLLRNSGERALVSQKSKVSNAEIHAACLFVRDFRVGLAPSQGQEVAPSVSHGSAPEEGATTPNCLGDGGGSIMSRKEFGNVRQTHDFSQQKLKVPGGGSAFAQMESKLPRRPQSRGKVGNSEQAGSNVQEASSQADVLRLQADEDNSGNNSALSVLVDVMERLKHESSQTKYLDLENQVSNTISPTDGVLDDSLRKLSHSQTSEVRRGLSYEEIHAMDEVDTPELHEIEDDSLLYDGGKDELELLESLHRSALLKDEVRAMAEEVPHESPKRRFVMAEEAQMSSLDANEGHESPKRRCVEVTGREDLLTRDAIVLHGFPSISHEDGSTRVTSMNLDDFQRRGEQNGHEVKCGDDEEESETLVGGRLQPKEQTGGMLLTRTMDFLSTSEKETSQTAATSGVKEAELLSSNEEDRTAPNLGVSLAARKELDLAVPNIDMDVEEESDCKGGASLLCEVPDADTPVVDTSRTLDVNLEVFDDCRKEEELVPEPTDRVVFEEQCGQPTTLTPDFSYWSEVITADTTYDGKDESTSTDGADEPNVHGEVGDGKNESTSSDGAEEPNVHGEVGDASSLFMDAAERESLEQKIPDGKMEENLTLDRSNLPSLEGVEVSSSMLVETDHPGSWMALDLPTQLNSQSLVGSIQIEESIEPHETKGANEGEVVQDGEAGPCDDMLESFSRATTDQGHQEGSLPGAESENEAAWSDSKMFVEASEKDQVQVKNPTSSMGPDTPSLKEHSLPFADEMEVDEQHGAVSESCELEGKGIQDPSSENGNHFTEELDNSVSDYPASVESLDNQKFLGDSASELASLSKLDGVVSHDFASVEVDHGAGQKHLLDSNSPKTFNTPSRNLDFSDNRIGCQVTGSLLPPQSVTESDVYLSSVSEPSSQRHLIGGSKSLEHFDTKSAETSDYYEATSEEKEDNQEVSSGIFMEGKEVGFAHPNAISSDGRSGISEVISRPKSRLSSSLSEMRSASSLCAALEEQLAGLIQKIDSAIEESSKPLISGQQEGVVGRDKLSARTSELLLEQEADESLEPVRSSQEDLLDLLWAEDDDSFHSEGSVEDELFQHDLKPFGKDGTPNQVNGEIRLSRSSESGLTLYSNGHPTEVSQDMSKALSTEKEDMHHIESRRIFIEMDENVKGVYDLTSPRGLTAAPSADTTAIPHFFEDDKRAAEHEDILDQQDRAESLQLKTWVPLEDPMDDEVDQGTSSCLEIYAATRMDSSEEEGDAPVEDGMTPDSISCLHAPLGSLSELVSEYGSLSPKASFCQLVNGDIRSTGEEDQIHEDETCTDADPVGESVSIWVHSSTVKEVEEIASQNSTGNEDLAKERSQDLQVESMVGREVVDSDGVVEDGRTKEVEQPENPFFGCESTGPRASQVGHSLEDETGCEDSLTGIRVDVSNFGLSAVQDLIPVESFAVRRPQSPGGVGDLKEQVSLGEGPLNLSAGESVDHNSMVEGPDTPKVSSAEQHSLMNVDSSQERPSADETTVEAGNTVKGILQKLEVSEVGRAEEYSGCEQNEVAEVSSPDSEPETSAQFSALDSVVAGEDYKEGIQEEAVAVIKEDSPECVPAVSCFGSQVLDPGGSLENPVTPTSSTKSDEDENLDSGLEPIFLEDGHRRLDERAAKEDHEAQQLASEMSSPPTPHDLPLPPILVRSGSSREDSELPPVNILGRESEELSNLCEGPLCATDEDLMKEELLFKLQVSEVQETRVSEQRSLVSSEEVQHSRDLEKAAVTDDDDSYQECISHDSNSLSISRSSVTGSSEQETYSAGTQGAGEDEQEETSQMQGSSSATSPGGLHSHSHAESLPNETTEDQVRIPEKTDVVDTPKLSSSDSPVDHSEISPSTENSISLQADSVVEIAANTLAQDPEQVNRENRLHSPVQDTHSAAMGNAWTGFVLEAGTRESHKLREDTLDIGHGRRSHISLGESPTCTEPSDVSKSDEVGSVDSPDTGETLKSGEVYSANLSADSREYQQLPSVSETRIPLTFNEDFISIEDTAWDEQLGKQNGFESSGGGWNTADGLEESGKSHIENGLEQPERQKSLPSSDRSWNMPHSVRVSEIPQTANGGDPPEKQKDLQEDVDVQRPSTGKEEATSSSIQSEVSTSEVTPPESVTAEAAKGKMRSEGDNLSDTGISAASVVGDKSNGIGSQSARKLPISKAKSVRTVSLTSNSYNEVATDGRLSPDGAVPLQRSTGYTSVTVVSPESLKWEPSTTGVRLSGSREADDSVSAGSELGKWSMQGMNLSPGSVRRTVAYMGQQASSLTSVDSCLQNPPTQVFERDAKSPEKGGGLPEHKAATEDMKVPAIKSPSKLMFSPVKELKSMNAPSHMVIEVSSKEEVPVKASKAKCSCTIM